MCKDWREGATARQRVRIGFLHGAILDLPHGGRLVRSPLFGPCWLKLFGFSVIGCIRSYARASHRNLLLFICRGLTVFTLEDDDCRGAGSLRSTTAYAHALIQGELLDAADAFWNGCFKNPHQFAFRNWSRSGKYACAAIGAVDGFESYARLDQEGCLDRLAIQCLQAGLRQCAEVQCYDRAPD